jgi:hypothetical protein
VDPVPGPVVSQQVKSPRLHCGAPSQTPPVLPLPVSTVATLPVPVSASVPVSLSIPVSSAPVPVPAPPVRVAVDPAVVQRVSVITEQSKLVNAADSTQSHNGGELSDFFNSRQQSVNNEVGNHSGNSDCVSSRTSDDFIMKEENNLEYTFSDSLGVGLPEQLSRPISESASVSSIPRTHTPHMPGESSVLFKSVASHAYGLYNSEEGFSYVGKFVNERKNEQVFGVGWIYVYKLWAQESLLTVVKTFPSNENLFPHELHLFLTKNFLDMKMWLL